MAKVIAFGDSFTWGSDMDDTLLYDEYASRPAIWQQYNPFNMTFSRNTWQSLLAQDKGMDYSCLAEQGCSNQSILRKFFDSTHLIHDDDIVTVGFTWRDRYDFYDDINQKWETVRPAGTEESNYFEIYYKHIQNSIWDQIESLKAINLIVDYLKSNNIKHIITCIDDLIYTDPHHTNRLIRRLQNIHKDSIIWFEGKGMYHWSQDKGYPISEMWHPLEDAHKAALQYLKDEKLV